MAAEARTAIGTHREDGPENLEQRPSPRFATESRSDLGGGTTRLRVTLGTVVWSLLHHIPMMPSQTCRCGSEDPFKKRPTDVTSLYSPETGHWD